MKEWQKTITVNSIMTELAKLDRISEGTEETQQETIELIKELYNEALKNLQNKAPETISYTINLAKRLTESLTQRQNE